MPPPDRDGGIPPDRRAVVRRDVPASRRGLRRFGARGHAHPLLLRHRRTWRDDPVLHPHPSARLFPLERVSPFSAGGSSAREAGPPACGADPVRGLGPGRVSVLHPVVPPASPPHPPPGSPGPPVCCPP